MYLESAWYSEMVKKKKKKGYSKQHFPKFYKYTILWGKVYRKGLQGITNVT